MVKKNESTLQGIKEKVVDEIDNKVVNEDVAKGSLLTDDKEIPLTDEKQSLEEDSNVEEIEASGTEEDSNAESKTLERETKTERLKIITEVEADEETDKVETPAPEEDKFPEIKIKSIKSIEYPTKSAVADNGEASDLRIINTGKNGKRAVLKQEVINQLELQDTVQLGFIEDTLIMTKEGISEVDYNLKKQGKTYVIYNSKMIVDITETLKLDYSNVTSINLDVKYTIKDGKSYLMARKY